MLMRGFVVLLGCAAAAHGQVLLRDSAQRDRPYTVHTTTELSGKLSLPAQCAAAARTVTVSGRSLVEYDERPLPPLADGSARSIRVYRKVEFHRTVAGQEQGSTIRPAARRMVLLRRGAREVPFSPDGPLTFAEIDLVRTDVFTPALAGLLPGQRVNVGERWPASLTAVEELTDLEKVEAGGLECQLTGITGQRARVQFTGTIRGVNEDGPVQHQLTGSYEFDLQAGLIAELNLTGVNSLLDGQGKTTGKIEGKFTLTRKPLDAVAALADASLRELTLEPNASNTLLVYESPGGVRFTYPRRWHLSAEKEKAGQITLDDRRGSGIVITVVPPTKVPTPADYLAESRAFFAKQKARVGTADAPRRLKTGDVHQFGMDVEGKDFRVRMEYFITRFPVGGATLAATLQPAAAAELRRDAEQIAASLAPITQGATGVKPLP